MRSAIVLHQEEPRAHYSSVSSDNCSKDLIPAPHSSQGVWSMFLTVWSETCAPVACLRSFCWAPAVPLTVVLTQLLLGWGPVQRSLFIGRSPGISSCSLDCAGRQSKWCGNMLLDYGYHYFAIRLNHCPFPGFKGCITLQLCNFVYSPDTCLYTLT